MLVSSKGSPTCSPGGITKPSKAQHAPHNSIEGAAAHRTPSKMRGCAPATSLAGWAAAHLAVLGQLNGAAHKLIVNALLHKQARAALARLPLHVRRGTGGRLLWQGDAATCCTRQAPRWPSMRAGKHPRPIRPSLQYPRLASHHVEEEGLVGAPHRRLQVGIAAHHHRRVAAQLQRDGLDVLGGACAGSRQGTGLGAGWEAVGLASSTAGGEVAGVWRGPAQPAAASGVRPMSLHLAHTAAHSVCLCHPLLPSPSMILLPTSVEPVKATLSSSGWVARASPHTLPLPGRMLSTPGGTPASRASSPRRSALSGVYWDTCAGGTRCGGEEAHAHAADGQRSMRAGTLLWLLPSGRAQGPHLEHDGASGGQRGGQLPAGHEDGEVPRDDLRRKRHQSARQQQAGGAGPGRCASPHLADHANGLTQRVGSEALLGDGDSGAWRKGAGVGSGKRRGCHTGKLRY